MKNLNYFIHLLSTNIKSAISLRGNFILQLIFMAINNLIFFSTWWIFFSKFDEINGWGLHEVEAMYGFAAGSFGFYVIFAAGVRDLSQMIEGGKLDSYLVLPKNTLVQISCSRSAASGWGDILSMFILLAFSGYLSPINLIPILILSLCASLIMIATNIMIHSLPFWLGPGQNLYSQLSEFLLTFSVYPQNIFPLGFRIVLFSLIPAGFVSFLPVEALRTSRYELILISLFATTVYLFLAHLLFQKGLRRYQSGNQISN